MKHCNKDIETQYIGDIPIDSIEGLPDYLLGERAVEDPSTGATLHVPIRVPSRKVFPNGNFDNVVAIQRNNDAVVVPKNQVRAGYVRNAGNMNVVEFASPANKPVFLIIGHLLDQVLVQNTGFVNIPAGHEYVISAQYYVGENGEPTTDNTSGIKLFIPISDTKLAVNMGW